MFQHLIDRILVEEPLVDCGGVYLFRDIAFFIPLNRVPRLFFFLRKLILFYAFADEAQWDGHGLQRHQIAIIDRFIEVIGIGGHASL